MTEYKPRETVLLLDAYSTIGIFWCVQLIDAGFNVRASVPSYDCADKVHDAAFDYVENKAAIGDQLSFVEQALAENDSWVTALDGIDALVQAPYFHANISSQRSRELLGLNIIPVDQAAKDASSSIIEHSPRWAS